MVFRVASSGGSSSLVIGAGATPIIGGTANRILFEDGTGTLAQSAGGAYDGVSMTLAAGTITTDIAPLRLTETRNAAGTTFKGFTYTITDTASAAGSLAMQILGGAAGTTNIISVRNDGNLTIAGTTLQCDATPGSNAGRSYWNNSVGWSIGSGIVYGISSNTDAAAAANDTALSRISAGLFAIGTGAAGSFAGRLKLTSAIHAAVAIVNLNASPTIGEIQAVNDALAPAVGVAVAAGGAANAAVWWNGAQWTVFGV